MSLIYFENYLSTYRSQYERDTLLSHRADSLEFSRAQIGHLLRWLVLCFRLTFVLFLQGVD